MKMEILPPCTQPVQGLNFAPLFHLTVLYGGYEDGIGGHCCFASELRVVVVTESNLSVCKKSETVSWQDETGV